MAEKLPGGYNGKILRVNLSDGDISVQATDELFCRKYLGGAGFVVHYLWKELPQGTDALAPGNRLVFAGGPVTGVPLPGSGRHCVGAKSPLTGVSPSQRLVSSGVWSSNGLATTPSWLRARLRSRSICGYTMVRQVLGMPGTSGDGIPGRHRRLSGMSWATARYE